MLDVHPPHAATHTWSDFWIHLGTITAGLLIAIGLEQSVEALHRMHERKVLMEDLRVEAEYNSGILRHNILGMRANETYYQGLKARALAADHAASAAQLPALPGMPMGGSFLPSAGAWTSARDSNQLSLLPRNIASVYEELYAQRDFAMNHFALQSIDAEAGLDHFTQSHKNGVGVFDPAFLSANDRATFETLLDQVLEKTDVSLGTTEFYLSENEAVLGGARSTEDLHRAVQENLK